MLAEETGGARPREFSVVETKRHKPCLIFHGYRYVQDKIQSRTIYWRCEDRARCNGRAHQLVGNGSLPILTIKHNHQSFVDDITTNETMAIYGSRRQRRRPTNRKGAYYQQDEEDDLFLSSTTSAMTSPIKLENHQNRQPYLQQHHDAMVKNLHFSEVISTGAVNRTQHCNGAGPHHHSLVDPIEMTKLLSNITTTSHSSSKAIPLTSTMDYSSRLNHFSWEEIEGRYLPVIFRHENDCLQRYTSKMYVENTLFQSESWQRHAILARSLPPLISFPYTENELKLFRSIVEWHLASFQFKTILSSDCLIRYDDLLDFYGALRKLRDTITATSFNRPLPPAPIPPPVLMGPPKQRIASASNEIVQSFQLPTMGGSAALKTQVHHRAQPAAKLYPSTANSSHSANYLPQKHADLTVPFPSTSRPPFHFAPITPKSTMPILPAPSQWNEALRKPNDKIRPPPPRPMVPVTKVQQHEQAVRDKRPTTQKLHQQSIDTNNQSRETKESGWVQINNVFVPYIIKLKLRETELEKGPTRQPSPQLQREFYVPYEILIKCHIFADNEFAFKKFLIKATHQDFDIFNNLISNINIFDEKVPEKTLLVNLYHVMVGLQRVLYIKLLTSKQPRSQVNKYHADVLNHKGGTLIMHGTKPVPYIVQNNRFYVPLMYAYQTVPNVLSQAKRGARAPRQYEIDYLNLLFLYFSIDSPPLTSDTLLVDAYSIKCSNSQSPIHFRTLNDHQQHERNRLLATITRLTQMNAKPPTKSQQQQQHTATKSTVGSSSQKSNKCPPANVVVNPLIHHPSFYGLHSSTSPIKPPMSLPPPVPPSPLPPPPSLHPSSSSSKSVVINPFLLPATGTHELSTRRPSNQPQIKPIRYDHHSLNAVLKSSDTPANDWKISIKHIFEQCSFQIDYDKFIQWCKTNLLLPLIKLDDEEKKIIHDDDEDGYYVYQRHLDRCIALLNDLKRGTISMTLLPPSNDESSQQQQQQATTMKSQLAGAKKRKTTVPTTRHIPSTQPSSPTSAANEPDSTAEATSHLSPELSLGEESMPLMIDATPIKSPTTSPTADEVQDDECMPIVAVVDEDEDEDVEEGEEQPVPESAPCAMDTSFLIVESNEVDDGKIQLDDTLPSCSSGYESAAALTYVDICTQNIASSDDDDDDDTHSTARSRHRSSSCQSEQSLAPILSAVSVNIKLNPADNDDNSSKDSSTVSVKSSTKSYQGRQRDKHGKFRARSRSPTPRNIKKKCSLDEPSPSTNTITSDQIEQHLRTLLMPTHEQRRTRTRPIKTPTRLVEEIPSNLPHAPIKTVEPDSNVFEILSSSSPTIATDTNPIASHSNEATIYSTQPCTYNVTISNKPNKLGLTIKKVVQR